MKILKSIVIGFAAIAALGGFTACQDDFDTPDLLGNAPQAELTPNTTIYEFKQAFWQDGASNYATKVGTKENGDHYIVAGRVITSDYAGNIYKSLVIQDETAALQFSINAYSLYQKYRIGQEIVIDLTDLYAGMYMGLFQIGAEGHSSSGAVQTSYMSDARFYNRAQLNGLPEPSKVVVHTLENMSAPAADNMRWQSELVRFNNVTAEPQETNLNEEGIYKPLYTFGIYHENFDQVIKIDGTGYKLRTSGYSNFYYELMPTEPFDIQTLLSYYNGAWQLYLIDYAGVMNTGNPTIPAGSEKNPWTTDQAIENIVNGVTAYGWTSGYIVGTVAPEITEVTSDDDIDWGTETDDILDNTVVIAPYAECRNYQQCLIVPLPQNSVMRDKVALKYNPDNLGKILAVQGTPDQFMKAFGITGNLGTAAEFKLEGVDLSGKGDGTETSPYNCAQIIAMNPSSTTDAVESGIWVHGYIVGYYENYEAHFEASTTQRANILISDLPNPTDKEQCVCIQLLANTEVREKLNLVDNKGMLGKEVAVRGDVMKYNSLPGIKNTDAYRAEAGDTPPPPATDNDGTEANPFNCAEVIAMNPSSTSDAVKSNVWVEGYIVGYYENYEAHFAVSTSQRANILISDIPNPTAKEQCVCIQLVANTDARNALNLVDNPGNLGKTAAVFGDIMKYNTLPGVKNTSSYKLDGQSGGDTPAPGDNLYEAPFKSSADGFTIHDIELASALSYVWQHDASYGYMKASAYVGQSYASNSWLVSPLLDLTAAQNPVLTFDHVTNKFPSLDVAKSQVSLAISVDGADWQPLTIPNWSDNASWTFVNSGDIDLSAYTGKKIKIGFHYTSTDGTSGTWEIKNLAISGTGSITATADSNFPGGGDTPGTGGDDPTPPTPSGDYKGDFNSFNGGTPKSSYGTYTNATGWEALNCNILSGTYGENNNPAFSFIGSPTTLAACMNGNTDKPGKITSPSLAGGISTLTFNYGYPYNESKLAFTINIIQNGSVVKTQTVTDDAPEKFKVYSFEMSSIGVTGDFSIEIINDCPSANAKNGDRVAIWNLTWE